MENIESVEIGSIRESKRVKANKVSTGFIPRQLAVFLALLVGYSAYYLCRQNLGVAYIPMKDSMGLGTIEFGWIASAGTLAYAVGKVLTGGLADSRLGGKKVFFIGLFGSAALSALFSNGTAITFFIICWSINRFFQSMGWGGLVNVMSRWFPKKSYGTAMGFMAISYQFGGVIAALFAAFLLSKGVGWQGLFIVPAATLAVIGLLIYPFIQDNPSKNLSDQPSLPVKNPKDTAVAVHDGLTYLGRFRFLLKKKQFLVMLSLSFMLTLLRECFNVWVPAYFSQMGLSASSSAFKSAVFPLLGCVGTLFAGWFSDRFLSGRRAPVMFGLMVGLLVSLLGLAFVSELSEKASMLFGQWFTLSNTAMLLIGGVGFFLLGPYSLVGGVVALDFGGQKTAGTAAGLLDGVGYLAATLSGIGVATLVVRSGWSQVFFLMAAFTVVAMCISLTVWRVRPE
ncbi:MAG: MFS transporter [Bdellovibrionota bacterium]